MSGLLNYAGHIGWLHPPFLKVEGVAKFPHQGLAKEEHIVLYDMYTKSASREVILANKVNLKMFEMERALLTEMTWNTPKP